MIKKFAPLIFIVICALGWVLTTEPTGTPTTYTQCGLALIWFLFAALGVMTLMRRK